MVAKATSSSIPASPYTTMMTIWAVLLVTLPFVCSTPHTTSDHWLWLRSSQMSSLSWPCLAQSWPSTPPRGFASAFGWPVCRSNASFRVAYLKKPQSSAVSSWTLFVAPYSAQSAQVRPRALSRYASMTSRGTRITSTVSVVLSNSAGAPGTR